MTSSLASTDQMPVFGLGAEKAFHAPLGATSPLWFAYAGAASAGLAYWWMTRWMRPFNIEALFDEAEPLRIPVKAAEPVSAALVIETETEAAPVAPVAEGAPVGESVLEAAAEEVVAAELSPVAEATVVEAKSVDAAAKSPAPAPVVESAAVKATPVKASPTKAAGKSAEAAPRAAAPAKPGAKASPARRG